MIYELMNKLPRESSFLYSEDVLTGTIFGNLRYFRDQKILINFLNESYDINGEKPKIDNRNIFDIYFWKKYYSKNKHKYNEPDLYLTNRIYDIIIECKYNSVLDEKEIIDENIINYTNQIIRYSEIIEKSNKIKIMIYLTNEDNIPKDQISKSLKKLNVNIHLFWLSWRKLYKVMNQESIIKYSHGEQQLFNDLLLFLKKRKLTVFCGFKDKNISIDWKYLKYYKYIPHNSEISSWRYKNEKQTCLFD